MEGTHSWLNRFRRPLARWEKKDNYSRSLYLQCTYIILKSNGVFGYALNSYRFVQLAYRHATTTTAAPMPARTMNRLVLRPGVSPEEPSEVRPAGSGEAERADAVCPPAGAPAIAGWRIASDADGAGPEDGSPTPPGAKSADGRAMPRLPEVGGVAPVRVEVVNDGDAPLEAPPDANGP